MESSSGTEIIPTVFQLVEDEFKGKKKRKKIRIHQINEETDIIFQKKQKGLVPFRLERAKRGGCFQTKHRGKRVLGSKVGRGGLSSNKSGCQERKAQNDSLMNPRLPLCEKAEKDPLWVQKNPSLKSRLARQKSTTAGEEIDLEP